MLNQMYEQYCANRLPCGICRLTNSQCPKACGTTIDWSKVTCTTTTNKNASGACAVSTATTTTSTNCSTSNIECIVNCGKGVENR